MSRFSLILVAIVCLSVCLPFTVEAQCAMCKAAAEGAMGEGSKKAAGINMGVLYLLAFPFILGGVFFYLYKKRKAETQAFED